MFVNVVNGKLLICVQRLFNLLEPVGVQSSTLLKLLRYTFVQCFSLICMPLSFCRILMKGFSEHNNSSSYAQISHFFTYLQTSDVFSARRLFRGFNWCQIYGLLEGSTYNHLGLLLYGDAMQFCFAKRFPASDQCSVHRHFVPLILFNFDEYVASL